MTYETVAGVTQSFSLLFFLALFIAIVIYALWPGNRSTFDRAARLPLDADTVQSPEGLVEQTRDAGERNG